MSTRTTEFVAAITGDANGAIAALEKVKVRVQETTRAAESANTKVANSTDLLIKNSEKAARGVAGITQALYAMEAEGSAKVLALGGAVGSFADLLGPQGKVVSGVAIVTSAIVALFLQAKEKSAEATKAIEADIARLVNAGDFAAITKRLQEIEQGTAGAGFQDGRAAIRQRIEDLKSEVLLAGKSNQFYLERQRQIVEERKKLTELTREYDRFFKALTDPATSARGARGLAGQPIVTSADSVEKQAADAKAAADKAQKAAKELQKEAEAFQAAYSASLIGTLSALNEAARELDERRLKGQAELAKDTAARVRETAALREQVAALFEGAGAYQAVLTAQAQATAVAEAQAKATAAGLVLSDEQIQKIREEIAERVRLTKVLEALQSLQGRNPFDISEAVSTSGEFADGLSRAASAASGIAVAFGEAGQRMATLLTQSAQLFTNLSRAQQAGQFRDENGAEQNVGFRGALTGQAGAAGVAAAVSSSLGIVGALASLASALDIFGGRAKERARQLAELAVEFNRSLDDFAITSRTTLEEALRDNIRGANELIKQATATSGLKFDTPIDVQSVADLDRVLGLLRDGTESIPLAVAALGPFIGRLQDLRDVFAANEEALRTRVAAEERRASEDLEVRRLAATGQTEAAEAERRRLAGLREIAEAEAKFGEDSPYVDALRLVLAAEKEAAAQTKLRLQAQQRDAFGADLTAREQTLAGDDRGAFITRQEAGRSEALNRAQELFEAGTITAELFDRLKVILGEELADAIRDFDDAVARAAERQQDDLRVRTLVAQGRAAEADALRQEIADREELRGITEETLIAQIKLVQELEAEFRAAQAAAEASAQARADARSNASNRVALFDLDGADAIEERLAGYGKAFSDLFASFDLTTLDGLNGAKEQLRGIFTELSGLSDDEIFEQFGLTRNEVIAALLDLDGGFDALVGSLKSVEEQALQSAAAAREFSEQLAIDLLRARGQNLEADIKLAEDRRDTRIKQAQQLGLGAEVIAAINEIFDADVATIRARFAEAAQAPTLGTGVAGELRSTATTARARARNTTVVGDFGGLSELTAQSLAGLLREVAINTSERGAIVGALLGRLGTPSLAGLRFPSFPVGAAGAGGTIVSIGPITVHIGTVAADGLTPSEAGATVARDIAAQLGRLAAAETRFLGSAVA